MGSTNSAISIRLDGTQPFIMGQQITGTVTFNDTLEKNVKIQKIYAEFMGKIVHTTLEYNGTSHYPLVHRDTFFKQSIPLIEKQDDIILDSGFHSWPISFSPPSLLPPSLNQLSSDGPYLHYKIYITAELSEKYKKDISHKIPVHFIAHPSSYLHPSFLPVEIENKNHGNIIFHAVLNNKQNDPIKSGETYYLNLELYNPKHAKIKYLSIDLIQTRSLWKAEHCSLKIPLSNPPDLQEFSGEKYHETLPLVIPNDDRIISSFRYLPSLTSDKPIAVEYVLKLEFKVHGLFSDIVRNIPVIVRSSFNDITLSID